MSDSGWDDDVNNEGYDSVRITVTSALEVEAKTTGVEYRQWVRIYNEGPGKVEVGPTGKPKEILYKNQGITFNHGPDNKVYVLAKTIDCDIIITESG